MRFLMNKCQTYGPVFLEAAKFEERIGNFKSSFEISEEGLYNNEKFSPLWFQYLKMLERKGNFKLEELSQLCDDAQVSISSDLAWKFLTDVAEMI